MGVVLGLAKDKLAVGSLLGLVKATGTPGKVLDSAEAK
jgi:hypothetical protein